MSESDESETAAGGSEMMSRDKRDPDRLFCTQCGNMWMPREEKRTKKLMLTCRTCDYEEMAHTVKVYENRLKKEASTRLDTINADVIDDPTLQRSRGVKCFNCHRNEAVLFQAESGTGAASLSLIFVCCFCKNKWVG